MMQNQKEINECNVDTPGINFGFHGELMPGICSDVPKRYTARGERP
jgi:hypothetical protein